MISITDLFRGFRHPFLSVALGSTALFFPLWAQAGFELTPAKDAAPITDSAKAQNDGKFLTGAPLPMYEGLKPVESAALPMPTAPKKPVVLDMKPLDKGPPVSASPSATTMPPAITSEAILPLPPEAEVPESASNPAPISPAPMTLAATTPMKKISAPNASTPRSIGSEESSLSVAVVKPVESQKMAPLPHLQTKAQPPAPMAPAMPAQNFAVIEGFGKDMPLALAMRQIVPANYAFSFAQGVNPGQRISWSGGAPWNIVLQKSVESSGLDAQITDQTVVISVRKPGSSLPAPAPQAAMIPAPTPQEPVAAPSSIPADRMSGRGPGAPISLAPMPLPATAAAPAASSAPITTAPPATAIPSRVKPFAKAAPIPATPRQGVDTESLLPPISSPSSVPDSEISKAVAPSAPAPMAAPAMAAPLPLKAGAALPSPSPSAAIAAAPKDEIPAYPHKFDASATRDWSADAGSTLRSVLSRWSREAGVQLYWSSEYDYPLQADVMLNGTYEKAVSTLLDGMRDAQPRPLGRLHPNPPDGPAVLIIETRHIIN